MSYRRDYTKVISGSVSGRVSYPASQNGGSTSVTLDWSHPVHISILVDTEAFEGSVADARHHVDLLTGAVVATETLQVAQKIHAAERISESVTKGFFTLIQSDITQQMAALKSKVDSLVLHMAGLKVSLLGVQGQMEGDYRRITDRYCRIFEDLDQETGARVGALDEAALQAGRQVAGHLMRPTASHTAVIPVVFGAEHSHTQTRMVAAGVRARMGQLLMRAKAFLQSERRLQQNLGTILCAGEAALGTHLPVLWMEAEGLEGQVSARLLPSQGPGSPLLRPEVQAALGAAFQDPGRTWKPMAGRAQVDRYLLDRVGAYQGQDPARDARVRDLILKLWASSHPQALSC